MRRADAAIARRSAVRPLHRVRDARQRGRGERDDRRHVARNLDLVVGRRPRDARVDGEITRGRIHAALGLLSDRERWIVERRALAETETTLEDLGRTLGISKERVRQIEARALDKLRDALVDLAA